MPRAIWSGAISFGLVSVPVKMHTAVKQKDVRFHQLDKATGARIRYKRVSEKSGREVPYEKIAKGYEAGKDRFVMIEPEELEALDPKATHTVEITEFVDLDQIDPIYFERTYYLAPDRAGSKAYKLLQKAMNDSGKIGIGTVVLRTKQYLAAIRPYGKILALETMYFPDEIVDAGAIEMPESDVRVADKELKMARQLIDSLAADFDPGRYHDEYRERVLELIRAKSKDKTFTVATTPEEPAAVVNLMDALRASVERSSGDKRRTAPRSKSKKKSA